MDKVNKDQCEKLGCTRQAEFGYRLCGPHKEEWKKSKESKERVNDLRPTFQNWLKK